MVRLLNIVESISKLFFLLTMTDFSDLFQILSMIFFLLTDGKSLVHVLQVNF